MDKVSPDICQSHHWQENSEAPQAGVLVISVPGLFPRAALNEGRYSCTQHQTLRAQRVEALQLFDPIAVRKLVSPSLMTANVKSRYL